MPTQRGEQQAGVQQRDGNVIADRPKVRRAAGVVKGKWSKSTQQGMTVIRSSAPGISGRDSSCVLPAAVRLTM